MSGLFDIYGKLVGGFNKTLTVTKTGNGTVTSSPAGINCGTDCNEVYIAGTEVTLTATPATDYDFAGWDGDADCTDGVVKMDADKTCTATFTLVQEIDLVESQVSDPPASVVIGSSFSVTDTVKNQGDAGAGASTTRYYLSTDTLKDSGDILLTGSRSVPTLSGGTTSSGSVDVTIPSSAVAGTSYYLLACADDTNTVSESDESNNCIASNKTMVAALPDLVETYLVSTVPATIPAGSSHSLTDNIKNQGNAGAGASTTRYYLSADKVKNSGDVLLDGSRSVPPLALGEQLAQATTVTIPVTITPGAYYFLACADDTNAVTESDETNNCINSVSTYRVTGPPDLIELSVDDPPATAVPGTGFYAADTVKNQGSGVSGAFTIRYYLSTNTIKDSADILLTGSRPIEELWYGASLYASADVTIPSLSTPGTYYLLACADDLNEVGESDETNNCGASSGTIKVTDPPDLMETSVSDPPATAAPWSSFSVTETVKNQGIGPAAGFTVEYYLDQDRIWGGQARLDGVRSVVDTLLPDATSSGTVNVTVPPSTPPGAYYLWVCVVTVGDANSGNNCIASNTTVQVTAAPDLVEMEVSSPPATAAAGDSFTVTDTVANIGNIYPPVSYVIGYYLSSDFPIGFQKDISDIRLTGSRMVTDPGMSMSTGSANVTIPLSVLPATYYLLACADDTNVVAESSETNNCFSIPSTILITPPQLPNLVESFVSDPPSTTAPGDSFSVTDTVTNIGIATAGPSTTRYYLSADFIKDGMDTLLAGSRSVGSLASGGTTSTGSAAVTIPSSIALGTYHLFACADDTKLVTEINEADNCIPSLATVVVGSLDTTPPTGSIVINGGKLWTKTALVTLTLSCSDTGSGCGSMRFSNNNSTWSTWEPYGTGKAWTLGSGNGTKSVYVQYRDNAGNISTTIIKDTIKLDTTKPVVIGVNDTPDPFSHHTGQVSTIGFTVSDNLAGTCKIELKIYDATNSLVNKIIKTGVSCPSGGSAGSVTWDGKGSLSYNGGALVSAGTYTYKVRAQDKALNWSAIKQGTTTAP